jgi:hypothetical protein
MTNMQGVRTGGAISLYVSQQGAPGHTMQRWVSSAKIGFRLNHLWQSGSEHPKQPSHDKHEVVLR